MTTITIKNGEKLPRTVFKTFEDLIEEYYIHKGITVLNSINYDELSSSSKKAIKESKKMGADGLVNFQG